VLLVTGAPAVETAVEALEYGAFQYLTKPVDAKRFEQAVEKAVQLPSHGRDEARGARPASGARRRSLAIGPASRRASIRAIETLWMAYQPIVRANDRTLFGYEALLRSAEPTPAPSRRDSRRRRTPRSLAAPRSNDPQLGRDACRGSTRHGPPLRQLAHPRPARSTLMSRGLAALEDSPGAWCSRITERASLDEIKDIPSRVARLREMGFPDRHRRPRSRVRRVDELRAARARDREARQ